MAENQEPMKPKEREIPVFTVLKSNCILKNIFLLDNPPSISSSSSFSASENVDQESEIEEILVVGRHPDCNIKLEHPSISRFHLRIHSKPSSRSLFVTDLSSVHGTLVSGKRIEPGITIKVNEGDTLQLGASSRLYRLNWVPLSRAYDIDDPFAPPLDALDTVNKETEVAIDQDEDGVFNGNNLGKGLGDIGEGLERLFADEDIGLSMRKTSPTAPPIPNDLYDPYSYKDENFSLEICNKENELSSSQLCQLDASITVDEETEVATDQDGDSVSYGNNLGKRLGDIVEGLEWVLSDEDLGMSMQKMSPTAPPIPEDLYDPFSYKDEVENNVSPEIGNKENELSSSQLCQLDDSVTVEEETEGATDQDGGSLPSKNDEGQGLSDDMEGLEWLFSDEKIAPSMPEELGHSFPEKDEDRNCSPEICNKEIEQGNSTPQAHMPLAVSQAETMECSSINSEKRSGLRIWSRRGKPKSITIETSQRRGTCARIIMSSQVKSLLDENCSSELMLKDHQCASPDNDDEIFTPDKENTSPNSYLVRSLKWKFEETLKVESISNSSNEESFTPDKENVTPDSRLLRSKKNVGRSGEVKRLNSYRPSPLKTANNENMCDEEVLVPKASQHQKVLQESKSTFSISKNQATLKKQQPVLKARADREPFHPLPMISTSDHKANSINSVHESTMRSCRSIKYLESEDVNQSYKNTTKMSKNSWTIVADTTSLLNRKSRNELQLLRGLRGTTLIIPRIVVRELDCMLRRASFFSRMTEASAALNWIEGCMAETKWWIHVQSSAEEGRLVPPTPPAASSHWFSEEKSPFSVGAIPFSPYTLQEIATPTPADHILECALLFRRTTNGQLVLLTDDVTLKIKAMAEGVICATVEEFRGSLVNPFSPRFLYSNSSPIGPTWSCFDDAVLKENYYPSPAKETAKSGEGAKGLKLILLHNSNFRQMTI